MFRIGSQDDSASLNNVIDLQLDIDSGSGPNTVMKFSDLPWAKPTVVAFFSSIGTTPPPPNQSSVWFPDLGKRVYVSDGASSFAPQSIGGKLWFRRKQDTGTAEHPGSANIRSLEVRLKTDKVPAATTLDLFLYDSFDVVFTKFGDARQGSHGVLLQLQPRTDERLTFFKEIRSQLAANPDWFTGANKPRFFDRNGTELHPAFVGSFSLTWTGRFFQDDTWALGTILYYGPPMDFPDALMLFPRPGTQTLKLMGSDPSVDPFGLRYELNLPGGTGNFSFDTLAPALSSDDEANFTVTTTFAGQYHFDLAQSISNIEGNLEVQYPAPVDPQNADSIDARQEYLHDLLNYNSVNVLARYFGKTDLRHLNPKTELFPVWTVKPSEQTTEAKDHYSSYFHFRYTLPITPATVTDQKSSAAFFKDLYSRLGEAVKLSFNIEHTYGTIIPLSSQGDATAFVNYAPILPNDLTLDGSIAKGFAPIDQRFCHIALVQGANTDHLMLTFNPKWLSPAWAADEALRPFHVAAWRSVAELAYAQKVVITGKFLRFNFATALDDTTDDVFAQGLESVADFANWQVDITALLTSAMYTSLANGELQTSTFDNIPLSVGTGVRVASSCTVVEFDLNLTRKPTVLPRASDSVMFVRPSLPLKIGPTGQSMEVVSSAQVNSAYEAWVNTLAQRTSPIQPSLNQQDQELARDLRNILGAGEAESGAWTPLLSSISQTGQVIPAICPLAFRPIATDAQLGDGTYLTVSNYLWALDCIFRAAVFESATMDVVAWQSYFKNLQVKSREIVNILTNMQKMLLPVPNTAASELDAEVKSAATELSQSNTAEFAATMQWLQMQIGAAPSIFGDSKAFLYTRLKGNGAGGLMPIDFVRLNFTKSLMRQETGIGKQSGMGTQQATDADRALVWESLRDLKSRPSFGFIETLDALRYGDEFQIADFSLSSLRGLVETVRVPAPGQAEPDQIALMGGKVHIPIGSVVPNTPQSKIKLPSRQPVIMPTHHFTGQIIFPEGMNFASLPANPLVRDSLLSGKIEPLPTNPKPDPSIPIACIVGSPPKDMTIEHAPASADQYVLSSIFSIRGDEQMIADWFDAFENDRFHINIQQLASAAVSSTGQVNDFIKSLTATIRPDTIPNLQTGVLSDDSIRLFTAALQPATPPGNIADIVKQPYLQIIPNGTGVTLAFIDSDGRPSKDFEAYLFKTAVASAGCKAPPTGSSMILAINRLATPWTASWTCIQQTRNLLDGSKQAHFANDFATAAPLAGPQMGIQPNVTKTMGPHTPPKILSRKLYTTAELVTQLLIPDLTAVRLNFSDGSLSV
jgi:hypothetical protein